MSDPLQIMTVRTGTLIQCIQRIALGCLGSMRYMASVLRGPGRCQAPGPPRFRYFYFLSPCILSPLILSVPILSPLILSVPILSPPILSVAILSPPILSVAILSAPFFSLPEVDESPQPTTASPNPKLTTSTAITDPILRMMLLL